MFLPVKNDFFGEHRTDNFPFLCNIGLYIFRIDVFKGKNRFTLIEDEIKEAELVERPSLDRFIFATTSSRDTKIQDIIREINHERIKKDQFKVDIWFWEDFQVHIESHKDLLYWYYAELLEDIHQYDKDIHILSMLWRAFTRPAFNREIRGEESGGDFIQAIKNTQEAISTGKCITAGATWQY